MHRCTPRSYLGTLEIFHWFSNTPKLEQEKSQKETKIHSSIFIVFFDDGQTSLHDCGRRSGSERRNPRLQLSGLFADECEGCCVVEALLSDEQAGCLFVRQPLHCCVLQVDDAQRFAHFLLGIDDGEVFQGCSVYFDLDVLSPSRRADEDHVAGFGFWIKSGLLGDLRCCRNPRADRPQVEEVLGVKYGRHGYVHWHCTG